jgi:hypothetical protein
MISDLPDSEFNSLITPQQARDLKQAISTLKVLDPAVGSGAFPLGMMQVILNVKLAIARREGMNIQRGSLTISQWKREIIANNLYGVDIKFYRHSLSIHKNNNNSVSIRRKLLSSSLLTLFNCSQWQLSWTRFKSFPMAAT